MPASSPVRPEPVLSPEECPADGQRVSSSRRKCATMPEQPQHRHKSGNHSPATPQAQHRHSAATP
eukprot:8543095-Alexandrium_andersonii.AAC.1